MLGESPLILLYSYLEPVNNTSPQPQQQQQQAHASESTATLSASALGVRPPPIAPTTRRVQRYERHESLEDIFDSLLSCYERTLLASNHDPKELMYDAADFMTFLNDMDELSVMILLPPDEGGGGASRRRSSTATALSTAAHSQLMVPRYELKDVDWLRNRVYRYVQACSR
eukprot:PhM_4_TR15545/c0_g1_i1/m.105042